LSGEKPKPTFEEAFAKFKLYIISIMMLPIIGLIAALAIIIRRNPENLTLIVAAILFMILFYAGSIYYFAKKMNVIKAQVLKLHVLSRG